MEDEVVCTKVKWKLSHHMVPETLAETAARSFCGRLRPVFIQNELSRRSPKAFRLHLLALTAV